jgi:hypothetical protein
MLIRHTTRKNLGPLPLILPGLFLLLLGLSIVFFPRLVLIIASAFLIWLGLIVILLAWKFYAFKKSIENAAKQMNNFQSPFSGGGISGQNLKFAWKVYNSENSNISKPQRYSIDSSSVEILDAEIIDADDSELNDQTKSNKSKIIIH